MKKHKIYVYGTLRPGGTDTVKVPGKLFNLGWFPGAMLLAPDAGSEFTAEIIEVDDAGRKRLDSYEGYDESSPATSLYLRVPYLEGEIYVYNNSLSDYPLVEGQDWLAAQKSKAGSAASMVPAATAAPTQNQNPN